MREVILSHDENQDGTWTTLVYVHKNNIGRMTNIKIEGTKSYIIGRHKMYEKLRKDYKKQVNIIHEMVNEYRYMEEK